MWPIFIIHYDIIDDVVQSRLADSMYCVYPQYLKTTSINIWLLWSFITSTRYMAMYSLTPWILEGRLLHNCFLFCCWWQLALSGKQIVNQFKNICLIKSLMPVQSAFFSKIPTVISGLQSNLVYLEIQSHKSRHNLAVYVLFVLNNVASLKFPTCPNIAG